MIYLISFRPIRNPSPRICWTAPSHWWDHRTSSCETTTSSIRPSATAGPIPATRPAARGWRAVYLAAKPFIGHLIFNKKVIILHILCVALIAAPLSALTATLFYFCLRRLDLAERRRILLTSCSDGHHVFFVRLRLLQKPLATSLSSPRLPSVPGKAAAGRATADIAGGLERRLAVLCDYPYSRDCCAVGHLPLAGGGWRRALAFVRRPPAGRGPAVLPLARLRRAAGDQPTSSESTPRAMCSARRPAELPVHLFRLEKTAIHLHTRRLAGLMGPGGGLAAAATPRRGVLAVAIALTTGLLFSGWVSGDVEYSTPTTSVCRSATSM
jgi:hypothetical protein